MQNLDPWLRNVKRLDKANFLAPEGKFLVTNCEFGGSFGMSL
jgi:hypothetical protein